MASEDPHHLGSWSKDRVLGSGGFGIVTLWTNINTKERVAIKKCRWGADSMLTETHKEGWAREVDIMQRLSHPNVVQAIALPTEFQGIQTELPLLCMEFCSGGDLRQILNKPENCCGLREGEVRYLLADLTAAVKYLHSHRITHRDLKPENIVLQEKPNKPMIYKLIDLGYAKEVDATSLCSSFVGTMQYLAPEFFTSPGYSSSVDYWSLGLVSHEAITGVRPFLPNATSPVQWIPLVEKKSANDICIYEVPGPEKEIKYSQQLFVENYISRCLREDLDKWLRLALEWNSQRRGRSQPDNRLTIFSMLDEILSKKIVTVFCVPVLQCHSYQVDSATAVSTLQQWIERDTKQPLKEQLLLLPTGKQLTDEKMAIDCWDPNELTMLYLFSTSSLSLPQVKVADRVPALVRWLMTNPDQPLIYHHQKHIWRHAVFFLRQEYELFQLFLEAYAVKMLSMLEHGHQLSRLEAEVGVEVEQLTAMQNMSVESLEFDNKCYARHLSGVSSLASVGELMASWAMQVNTAAIKVTSLCEVQNAMRVKVQKVLRSAAILQEDGDCGHPDLLAFEKLLKEGYDCYDILRRQKDKSMYQNSREMGRIVYNCFKQIDISLCNQPFDKHLKLVGTCEDELQSTIKSMTALRQQVKDTRLTVMRNHLTRQKDMWSLIQRLTCSSSKEPSFTNPSANSATLPHFNGNPSPLATSSLTAQQLSPQGPKSTPQPPPHAKVVSTPSTAQRTSGFDTSTRQQPMFYPPALNIQSPHKAGVCLSLYKSAVESDSLIQDNINIRYAMQDSLISFTQSSNSIADNEFDWSYLDTFKKSISGTTSNMIFDQQPK